jgi:hypothetical protein
VSVPSSELCPYHPLSCKRVSPPPPPESKGGTHSAAGVPIRTTGEKAKHSVYSVANDQDFVSYIMGKIVFSDYSGAGIDPLIPVPGGIFSFRYRTDMADSPTFQHLKKA